VVVVVEEVAAWSKSIDALAQDTTTTRRRRRTRRRSGTSASGCIGKVMQ